MGLRFFRVLGFFGVVLGTTACGNEILAPGLNDHRVTVDGDGEPGGDPGSLNADQDVGTADDDTGPIVVTTMIAASPTTQSTYAGMEVDEPPAVIVRDNKGSPMAGQAVRFTVDAGEGALDPAVVTTDAQGRAELSLWKLGKRVANNTVHARLDAAPQIAAVQFDATVLSNYTITVEFLTTMTPQQHAAFENAAARWSAIIVGDLPDFTVARSQLPASCARDLSDTTPINVDDMIIFASIGPIDGPLGILAQAAPCAQHNTGGAIAVGVMSFDIDDIQFLETNGVLEGTILHEMGHVIGIGSLWSSVGLLVSPSLGSPGANTRFTGAATAQAFTDIGGVGFPNTTPVENNGVGGSADAHWRESIFGIELMSPQISGTESSLPLSAVTVASLKDLNFYTINDAASDDFMIGQALSSGSPSPAIFECTQAMPTELAPLSGGVIRYQ